MMPPIPNGLALQACRYIFVEIPAIGDAPASA